jgi:AcrR family transcriptional regulator
VSDRPFHHGNLRAVLLDQAEAVLRERGIDALSLRELAREAGVSHGAPRSHFADRGALLDALAERGYVRLADEIRDGASAEAGDFVRALRGACSAYVTFAVRQPALLDLMFAAKSGGPSPVVHQAADRLFQTMTDVMRAGAKAGAFSPDDIGRLTLVLTATTQGVAALAVSRRMTTAQSEALLGDAITLFLAGASADL